MTHTMELIDLDATQRFGERLGKRLLTGDVLALIGPLGAGKTTLTKGIAQGAGVADAHSVNSPTFVLINEYDAASLHLYHIDAYRLRHAGDLAALGFEEMPMQGVVLIEWADRVGEVLPPDHLRIELSPTGEFTRRVTIAAGGPRSRQLLQALVAPVE